MTEKPAFIIAATSSGCGKTTITVGVLAALVKRGLKVQCFKCGPDFIDPTLHRSITAKTSYNLDLRMMGRDCCRETFFRKSAGADVVVVEGVMGLFDGGEASTAALAKTLGLPIFLVVDAKSVAESAAATLQGFQRFDPELSLAGVIFNRIGSARHRQLIDNAVKQHCSIPYIGYFGRDERCHIPQRHLGLHMGGEKPLGREGLEYLIETVEKDLDLDLLLGKASIAFTDFSVDESRRQRKNKDETRKAYRLGVAVDEAFCFYYPQNFELFAERGFEIVEFSPIHDARLPADLDMLYFGGGYPENFAAALSRNTAMRDQIAGAHNGNLPIYSECGGFMYLCQSLTDMHGDVYPMVGIFDCHTSMNRRLRKLGYRRATLLKDCLLGNKGDVLHGHEFHYSDIDKELESLNKEDHLYALDNNLDEGYSVGAAVGSYIHLHFGNTVSAIDHIADYLSANRSSRNDDNQEYSPS